MGGADRHDACGPSWPKKATRSDRGCPRTSASSSPTPIAGPRKRGTNTWRHWCRPILTLRRRCARCSRHAIWRSSSRRSASSRETRCISHRRSASSSGRDVASKRSSHDRVERFHAADRLMEPAGLTQSGTGVELASLQTADRLVFYRVPPRARGRTRSIGRRPVLDRPLHPDWRFTIMITRRTLLASAAVSPLLAASHSTAWAQVQTPERTWWRHRSSCLRTRPSPTCPALPHCR